MKVGGVGGVGREFVSCELDIVASTTESDLEPCLGVVFRLVVVSLLLLPLLCFPAVFGFLGPIR